MQVMKGKNYDWYIFKRDGKSDRDWFLVKYASNTIEELGMINMSSTLRFPKEFIGKRVRLKIEIIDDKDKES